MLKKWLRYCWLSFVNWYICIHTYMLRRCGKNCLTVFDKDRFQSVAIMLQLRKLKVYLAIQYLAIICILVRLFVWIKDEKEWDFHIKFLPCIKSVWNCNANKVWRDFLNNKKILNIKDGYCVNFDPTVEIENYGGFSIMLKF